MSWKWEMFDTDGKWITNALRFATEDEAKRYGFDLGLRWLGMPDPARAAECDDPVTAAIVDNKLVHLDLGVPTERADSSSASEVPETPHE